jgi:hypothetical protein
VDGSGVAVSGTAVGVEAVVCSTACAAQPTSGSSAAAIMTALILFTMTLLFLGNPLKDIQFLRECKSQFCAPWAGNHKEGAGLQPAPLG